MGMRRFESFIKKDEQSTERGMLPSAAGTEQLGSAASIKKATSAKSSSANIAMAQAGAKVLGVGPSEGDTSTEGGAAEGAMAGAAMGSSILPGWGTAIGAVVGGIAGGLNASAAQAASYKKAKLKAQATHANNLSRIEQEKDQKIQGALDSMKAAFGKGLQSNKTAKL